MSIQELTSCLEVQQSIRWWSSSSPNGERLSHDGVLNSCGGSGSCIFRQPRVPSQLRPTNTHEPPSAFNVCCSRTTFCCLDIAELKLLVNVHDPRVRADAHFFVWNMHDEKTCDL